MSLGVEIKDPANGHFAKVSDWGEVATSQVEPSEVVSITADVINTGYNLIEPRDGYDIFITGIILYANKNVGAADATVTLYENGTSGTDTTEDKVIINTEMPKNDRLVISGIRLKVSERGRWVNVKTDDDDIFATLFFYYAET